jgi:DNA-binding NtrC family response regulator
VFLDEIGELPLEMQPRLLRVLEARTIKRLGENHHRSVDVRFICATHRSLDEMVSRRAFREDLFFRLSVLEVRVPSLRERPGDIPALVRQLRPDVAERLLEPARLRDLASRPWPGNVRELRNTIERMAVLGACELPEDPLGTSPPPPAPAAAAPLPYRRFRDLAFQRLERAYLLDLLGRHRRHIGAAAAEAQVHRSYLHRLIRRHGL